MSPTRNLNKVLLAVALFAMVLFALAALPLQAQADELKSISSYQVYDRYDRQMIDGTRVYPKTGSPVTPFSYIMGPDGDVVYRKNLICRYTNNINSGTAELTIEGVKSKGYTGTLHLRYKIRKGAAKPKTSTRDISKAKVKFESSSLAYTGGKRVPKLSVRMVERPLYEGRDYIISCSSNIEVGTAKISLIGKGDFTGMKTGGKFKIVPANMSSAKIASMNPVAYTGSRAKPHPQVTLGGKVLKAGTDYTYSYKNNLAAGELSAKLIVTGKGNYTGQTSQRFSIRYAISYNTNGGTLPPSAPSMYVQGTGTSLPIPTRAGYTFKGWTGSNGTTPAIAASISPSDKGNKTYTANWAESEYMLMYKLNGGTNAESNPSSYNSLTGTSLADPTRTAYSFGGWYLDSEFSNKVTEIPAGSTGSRTLYAKWNPVTYHHTSAASARRIDNISTMKSRYAKHTQNGIALVGTAYMSEWDAELVFDALGFDVAKLYNFAIGGDQPSELATDSTYINMIAEKTPQVIVINGADDLFLSPKDSSKDTERVNAAIRAQSQLISNLRTALQAKGISNVQFIVTSSLKTPYLYSISVDSSQYDSTGGPSTCCLWNRVDTYNSQLKDLAAANSDVSYYDLQPFFYKIVNGKIRYYLNSTEYANSAPTGDSFQLLAGGQYDELLGTNQNDRCHQPTAKAYIEQFPALANKALSLYPAS